MPLPGLNRVSRRFCRLLWARGTEAEMIGLRRVWAYSSVSLASTSLTVRPVTFTEPTYSRLTVPSGMTVFEPLMPRAEMKFRSNWSPLWMR